MRKSMMGALLGALCFVTPVLAGISNAPSLGSVTTFFSPHNRDGTLSGITSFNYPLPSTTQGRYVFERISNGEPGGSGALGSGQARAGGSGGAPGVQPPKWSITAADFVARWPGTTSLTVNFGTLGTPGAAVSTANTAGNNATQSSPLVITSNTGAVIETVPTGTQGLGGPLSTGNANGGATGVVGAPTNIFSAGGGSAANGAAGLDAGNALFGPSGGAGAGGVTASETESAGGRAGLVLANPFSTRGSAGTTGGGNGGTAVNAYFGATCDLPGVGGSGGGSSVSATVNGGNGGAGMGYGAGGAGGGAGKNGALSGYGGAPTAGCWQATYFPN